MVFFFHDVILDLEEEKLINAKTITIPGTVKSIGEGAFSTYSAYKYPGGKRGCNAIKKLVIEEGVESIEAYAFYDGVAEMVEFPNSLISIGKGAFQKCFSFNHGWGSSQEKYYPEYEIEIPEGVKSIGKEAFKECKSLGKITLPYSLETIDANAFYDCVSLEKVLPEGYGSNDIIYHLKLGRNLKLKNGSVINW